jgi:hypothetical protein
MEGVERSLGAGWHLATGLCLTSPVQRPSPATQAMAAAKASGSERALEPAGCTVERPAKRDRKQPIRFSTYREC